jgi:DNA-binding GntR family transcriptional regulator
VSRTRHALLTGQLPPLKIDRADPAPLYFQVARHIEDAVEAGRLRPGDQLDGEIGLAERWGISRATMRRAIEELVARGILVRKHGVGTQVMPRGTGRSADVTSLYDELVHSGRAPSTRVLRCETRAADNDVATALGLEPGVGVVYLERLRSADAQPIALMRNWLPVGLVEVDASALEQHGLYDLLRAAGIEMRIAQQSIGAESASTEYAELLGVSIGTPVLTIDSVTYAYSSQPIDLGRHAYHPSRYRFQITNVAR